MSDPATVTDELLTQIEAIKAARGDTVAVDEVGALVAEMLGSLKGDVTAADVTLRNELRALIDEIAAARAEVATIRPEEIPEEHIPQAADELDAIVKATEEATEQILAAAETLEGVSGQLEGEAAQAVDGVIMQIYEASSFQDLCGQRTTRVVNTLKHIEDKVFAMAAALGLEVPASRLPVSEAVEALDQDDLLHGPSSGGVSQSDIDALFD